MKIPTKDEERRALKDAVLHVEEAAIAGSVEGYGETLSTLRAMLQERTSPPVVERCDGCGKHLHFGPCT